MVAGVVLAPAVSYLSVVIADRPGQAPIPPPCGPTREGQRLHRGKKNTTEFSPRELFSSFLFFGKGNFSPSTGRFYQRSVGCFLVFIPFLFIFTSYDRDGLVSPFITMPISNGDARGLLHTKGEIQDYTKALEVLKEYKSRDGLDVDTLLDSDKHGALTYNDFLILPGYIGAIRSFARVLVE